MSVQKPLELILARNLLSSISTPAFLVGDEGMLLFYNEAAGALVGRRFEEHGQMTAEEWTTAFGPFDEEENPIPYDVIELTVALRDGRPSHGRFRIAVAGGHQQEIEASAIPIVGANGSSGAIVIFWPLAEDERSELG
jgi:PAS domain-containing protein